MTANAQDCDVYDIVVVGAGFAGLYALHTLRNQGWRVRVLEAGSDLGGTWYWNSYPGARCDVQSLVYCYMFDRSLHEKWRWTERYATQGEILKYLNFVSDSLDLRKDISFDSTVAAATYSDASCSWDLATREGRRYRAQYVVMASGPLSSGRLPDLKGLNEYRGSFLHTGSWPKEGVDFSGKKVAVVGTGSSGVQAIPPVAQEAEHLTVFQRTAGFVAPARNTSITASEREQFYGNFDAFQRRLRQGEIKGTGDVLLTDHLPPEKRRASELSADEREAVMEARWAVGGMAIAGSFSDTMIDPDANEIVADFFRRKIRETVRDPATAELLTPRGYPFGSKRVCVGTHYYETYNRPNVSLVDASKSPIEAMTTNGLCAGGREYEFDIVVFATGFEAITGALTAIDIKGRTGKLLKETWSSGPMAYLGVAVAGFPNLFLINGPGSPSVLANVVVAIEQHVDWIAGLLDHARERKIRSIDVDPMAQMRWSRQVADEVAGTLFIKGKSWYLSPSNEGSPPVFLPYVGGVGAFRAICDEVTAEGYEGFLLNRRPDSSSVGPRESALGDVRSANGE